MQRFLRHLTMQAVAAASLLIAPHSVLATPPAQAHRPVITRVAPVYPVIAKRMHVTGDVVIRVMILPNGSVSETHIESGHALLRQSADEAVHQWHFASAPSPSECIITVSFEDK